MPEATGRTVVLGVDTATVVCVGLAIDGTAVATAQVDDRMAHVEQLTPLIRRVCADAGVAPTELTDVVVGLGPGPYTGLRVGIVTARVLAEIAGARLHGICSLDVIAAQYATAAPGGEFVVATDARRKEVYWARYAGGRHPSRGSVGERGGRGAAAAHRRVPAASSTRTGSRSSTDRPPWIPRPWPRSVRVSSTRESSRSTCAAPTPPNPVGASPC